MNRATIFIVLWLGLSAKFSLGTIIYRDADAEAIIIDDSSDAPDLSQLELIQDPEESQEVGEKCDQDGIKGVCSKLSKCYPYFEFIDNVDLLRTGFREFVENATRPCEGKDSNICCGERMIHYAKIRNKLPSRLLEPTTNSPPMEDTGDAEECGNNDSYGVTKEVFGRPAARQEFPYATALLKSNTQYCSGSLVAPRWVLTAAHCVNDLRDLSILSVNIGEHDLSSPLDHVSRGVDKVLYHSQFSMQTLSNDIALLRLKEQVPFSSGVSPICLSSQEEQIFNKSAKSFIVGWGRIVAGRPSSTTLQTVPIRAITLNDCKGKYDNEPPFNEDNICGTGMTGGSSEFVHTCMGDSGSPLARIINGRTTLIGWVSWGIGCGEKPGVYTRVDRYWSWIDKNINA